MWRPSRLGWFGVVLFLAAFVPQQIVDVEYKYKIAVSLFGILLFYVDQWRLRKTGRY